MEYHTSFDGKVADVRPTTADANPATYPPAPPDCELLEFQLLTTSAPTVLSYQPSPLPHTTQNLIPYIFSIYYAFSPNHLLSFGQIYPQSFAFQTLFPEAEFPDHLFLAICCHRQSIHSKDLSLILLLFKSLTSSPTYVPWPVKSVSLQGVYFPYTSYVTRMSCS